MQETIYSLDKKLKTLSCIFWWTIHYHYISPAIITITLSSHHYITALQSHTQQGEVYCSNSASKIYAQAGASKFGNTMNEIDKGLMYNGEFTSRRTGSRFGMFSSSVSSNGIPLRTMVRLRRFPSFAVKWYSSLYIGSSDARLPTHETDLLRPRMKEFSPDMFSSTVNLMSMLFWTLIMKSVWLLKLISSNVIPACIKMKILSVDCFLVDNQEKHCVLCKLAECFEAWNSCRKEKGYICMLKHTYLHVDDRCYINHLHHSMRTLNFFYDLDMGGIQSEIMSEHFKRIQPKALVLRN